MIHTNSIESRWNVAKVYIKEMKGVPRSYLKSYICEFVFRRNFNTTRTDASETIIEKIAKQYILSKTDEISKEIDN